MESYILSRVSVTMDELCSAFGISMNTARRDLTELVKGGRVQKVYGGAQARMAVPGLVPYSVRSNSPSSAKRAICLLAAKMVKDGDIVFIDSGTTTEHIMEALRDKNITVITNNFEVMLQAMDYENIRLIVVPGELNRKTHSVAGEESAAFLNTMNTNIAFMAATGASQTGVTNSTLMEYTIKKAAVAHTEKAVLLVTANKFEITSLFTYAKLEQFHTVITDDSVTPEQIKHLKALNIDVQIASAE